MYARLKMDQMVQNTSAAVQKPAPRLPRAHPAGVPEPRTNDPERTREAILQVWHQTSGERVIGLGAYAAHAEVSGVVDAAHELAVTALGTEHAARVATLVVDALFEWFGGYTLAELLDQLEWPRDEVIAHLVPLASFVVDTLRASGDLERLLRAQLEPFYASAEVADLLR